MSDDQYKLTTEEMSDARIEFIRVCQLSGISPILLPEGVFADDMHQIFFQQHVDHVMKLKCAESRNQMRLNEALGDIVKRRVESGEDAMEIMKETGIIHCFVTLSRAFLEKNDIKNYVEMSASIGEQVSDNEQFVINIRRKSGMTPHFLRIQAEQQRDAARQQVAETHQLLMKVSNECEGHLTVATRSQVVSHFNDDKRPARASIEAIRNAAGALATGESGAMLPAEVIVDIVSILSTTGASTVAPGIGVALDVLDEVVETVGQSLVADAKFDTGVTERVIQIIRQVEEDVCSRLQETVFKEQMEQSSSSDDA
jgi:hypothetical protein